MEYLDIGRFVDTHGIKGEIRISLNDFIIYDINENRILKNDEVINLLFKKNNYIYIGNNKECFKINSYRHHKIYEMITFEGISNINEIISYKKENCYVDNNVLNKHQVALSKLINFNILYEEKDYGKIVDYENNNGNILLKIKKEKVYYIPVINNFICNVDMENKSIIVKNIEGLII